MPPSSTAERPGRHPGPTAAASAGHGAAALQCPACGSTHVAQVLGDNGGVTYVCTACGHSWS